MDSKELTKNFPVAIEQAINFVHNHIFSAIKINDIRYEKEWSIPKIALREAIINAIVHILIIRLKDRLLEYLYLMIE